MLHVQEYLKTHTLEQLTEELGIKVTKYDDRVGLNYSQIDSPKFHPIVRECRSLILHYPSFKVMSRSFDRFYNLGEDPNSDSFDIHSSVVMEKLDGSLINIYFDGYKWCASTRSMAFAEGPTPLGNTFFDLIKKALGDFDLNDYFVNFDRENTYIFELTSPETRVVKAYQDTKLYLLAVRNKNTGNYCDSSWRMPGIGLPKKYTFKNLQEILASMRDLEVFDEGYVCIRKCDWRVKIKNPAYLAIAHLRDNGQLSKNKVAYLVFENEYEEYLQYFECDRHLFAPYIEAYDKLMSSIRTLWEKTKHLETQKDFALAVKDTPYSAALFALRRGASLEDWMKTVNERLRVEYLEKMI